MRRPGRIRIFFTIIHKFLVNLRRQNKNLFIKIDENITERYLSKKALSYFEEIKPSESAKTLDIVRKDLFEPVQQFRNNKNVNKMLSFKLMLRVLYEQCDIDKSDGGRKIKLKKPKEIKSKSLQTPSDADAAYNSKKGRGYHVQIMETYTDIADQGVKQKTLNLITHVEVEKASKSDAKAIITAIEKTKKRKLEPEVLNADTFYGSDCNSKYTKSKGIDLIFRQKNNRKRTQ